MKKLISLMIAAIMLLSLAACGEAPDRGGDRAARDFRAENRGRPDGDRGHDC